MHETEEFVIIYKGNVRKFEEQILTNAEQEVRIGRRGPWCQLADIYARQLTIIRYNPYPEENIESDDQTPPSIKHIDKNTEHANFYRWGMQGGKTGNHRIIFAIHNYHKVIMLYHFDKQYNGLINRSDLIPAEVQYEDYSIFDPSYY